MYTVSQNSKLDQGLIAPKLTHSSNLSVLHSGADIVPPNRDIQAGLFCVE